MSRALLGLGVLVVVIGVAAVALAAGGEDAAALEKRVKELESELRTCETRLAEIGALETEAQAAFNAIKKLADEGQYDKARADLATFQGKYGKTQVARRSGGLAQELAVLGKAMPEELGIEKWFQGENEVELSGQKPTLLVFWEEWCPHCRREVPKLELMYTEHKGSGLQLVGLTRCSKSSTEEKVQAFIDSNKVTYPIAKENGQLASYFGVRGIPAAALLKDGKVVWRGHPGSFSEALLKKWL